MSVLLATDTITVLKTSLVVADSHGWAEPQQDVPSYDVAGNLQVSVPTSNRRAQEAGGAGPHDPSHKPGGICYLDPDSGVEPGDTLVIRDKSWLVEGVQDTLDPVGLALTVLVAYVSSAD